MSETISKEEFVKQWVAALRSGDYAQVQGSLHTDCGCCCLGVGCEVGISAALEIRRELVRHSSYEYEFAYNGHTKTLPEVLGQFLGIDDGGMFIDPVSVGGNEYLSLVQMNDDGVPFDAIANVIEEAFKTNNFVAFFGG